MSRFTGALLIAAALAGCAAESDDGNAGVSASGGGKADGASSGFLASLPGWGRYIVLDKLDEIVPVYLAETESVLARIDALPGPIPETTALDDVPIPDLFASGQVALLEVLDDADFAGGRSDYDVAWLRNSAVELEALRQAVADVIADGTSPDTFDEYLTNTGYSHNAAGDVEIDAGIAAVSRYYCNLDIQILDDADGFQVSALESCD
jgi:hypothetical protein